MHFGNEAATLHDIGEGVACFRMHTKMNSFHPDVFEVLERAIDSAGTHFKALLLGNDDPRSFSVGADLAYILSMIDSGGTKTLNSYIQRGQQLFLALRRSPVPVVAAVHGFALGGGCEFSLHADAVVALADANMGLPETKVGLIPAWGGCTTLLARAQQNDESVAKQTRRAFETILPGTIFENAQQAKATGVLRDSDEIVGERSDLLAAAKKRALVMVESYQPPSPASLVIGGASVKSKLLAQLSDDLSAEQITATDYAMAEVLAEVLTGGSDVDTSGTIPEDEMMTLERAALVELVTRPSTRARMDHMLKTGKPLRN